MENTSDSFMPRPLLFCLKSGRSVCYSVPDNREEVIKMSNKAWRIVALLFIVVPIIICIIISFIITYFPTSDVSLILASDFLPIAIKIQGVGILIAILVSIFKIKKD